MNYTFKLNEANRLSIGPMMLMAFTQAIASLLPGLFLQSGKQLFSTPFILLIFYLVLSNISLTLLREGHRRRKHISIPIYGLKLVVSAIFILNFINKTTLQFGLLLLIYEVIQLIAYLKSEVYQEMFFFPLMIALFQGGIFNSFLIIHPDYELKLTALLPLSFSVALWLSVEFLAQGFYLLNGNKGRFGLYSVGASLIAIIISFAFYMTGAFSLLVFFIVLLFIIGIYVILTYFQDNVQQLFSMTIMTIIIEIVFYIQF
ncbi:hypothetical protein M2909_08075 [Vagococcus lutrae]|uniref:hypothetical protein n=1 Tax=Vagococcus lutrae TaxID=81947 RepID=UPI00200D2BF0|nr:hypothetical protein [Vagococcus lutrae]UQF23071.1 hypothetical protein M2909_08075 [Vagococcus lutrae]UQF64847.1 hypothetical protein M2908_03640 [Vagococcus lutrae]